MRGIQVGAFVTLRHSCRYASYSDNEALWRGVAIEISGDSVLVRFDCGVEDWHDADDLYVES